MSLHIHLPPLFANLSPKLRTPQFLSEGTTYKLRPRPCPYIVCSHRSCNSPPVPLLFRFKRYSIALTSWVLILIQDLDHIDGKVSSSITSKRYMCSEIWLMITYMGAPVWYITLSPANNKHPYVYNKKKLDITLTHPANECYRLIAKIL